MAAHRKPKQSPLGGQAGRTAATLALASAATATLFEGSGHAEPRPTTAQVKEKVDRLYEEAEVATERYNGAKEKADEARAAFERLRDEAARRTQRLNTARDGLGAMAAAQYRAGGLDPAVRLALTSNPAAARPPSCRTARRARSSCAPPSSRSWSSSPPTASTRSRACRSPW